MDIRSAVIEEISRLQKVLALLDGNKATVPRRTRGKRRKMSKEGRAKIAAAQRARWAKLKKSA